MSKHTPGPWAWKEGTDAIDVNWNNHSWTIASVGNCRLGWHEDKNCEGREAGANARLIASAPDLLEALEIMIIGACAVGVPHSAERKVLQDAVDHARAVINKATGVSE